MTSFSEGSTFIVNIPSKSVITALVVPSIFIVAPIRGSLFSSNTCPEIVTCCANATVKCSIRNNVLNSTFLFIVQILKFIIRINTIRFKMVVQIKRIIISMF